MNRREFCVLPLILTGCGGAGGEMAEYQLQPSPTRTSPNIGQYWVSFRPNGPFSNDVNVLDAYEEGIWTPTISFSGGNGDLNVVYSVRTGQYTRIGNQINLRFQVELSTFTHSTASGTLQITGCPFSSEIDAVGTMYFRGITKANYTQFTPLLGNGLSLLVIRASGSAQVPSNVGSGDMPTGGTVILWGNVMHTYFARV